MCKWRHSKWTEFQIQKATDVIFVNEKEGKWKSGGTQGAERGTREHLESECKTDPKRWLQKLPDQKVPILGTAEMLYRSWKRVFKRLMKTHIQYHPYEWGNLSSNNYLYRFTHTLIITFVSIQNSCFSWTLPWVSAYVCIKQLTDKTFCIKLKQAFSLSFIYLFLMVLSFSVERKPFCSGPGQLSWCHLSRNAASYCETNLDRRASKKPVWQVGNWCTGHARLCEEKNKGLREWWRLEVGGVMQGGGRQTYLRMLKWRSVETHSGVERRVKEKRVKRRGVKCGTTMH